MTEITKVTAGSRWKDAQRAHELAEGYLHPSPATSLDD